MKPAWLKIAEQEIGVHETQGGETPRILEYHACTTLHATEDEVPWCSAFVNWCMKQAGVEGTHLANARSWLDWGQPIYVPEVGAVVVLKRGQSATAGHVGFVSENLGDLIKVLGGNQSDSVKYSTFPKKDVLGYRLP